MRLVAFAAAGLALAGCTPVELRRPQPAVAQAEPPQLRGMQYLYGSGEGAAISRQAWNALVNYVLQQRNVNHRCGGCYDGAVLTPSATLADPRFERCGPKPQAIVLDVDETVLLNLGAEADDLARGANTFDEARWNRFERSGGNTVVASPGAVAALNRLRELRITVIFNSNRKAANAAESQAAIEAAGLGPAVHGETLFLAGDDATGSRKDMRRALIASRYCVIAMVGDQLGDFSDLFRNAGSPAARRAATGGPIDRLWGQGWFLLPNPVYGPALAGGIDDIFPADKRWHDPADGMAKELN